MQRGWQPVHAARKKAGPCSNTGQHLLTLNMSLSSLHLATFKCPCLLLLHTHSSYSTSPLHQQVQPYNLPISLLCCALFSLSIKFIPTNCLLLHLLLCALDSRTFYSCNSLHLTMYVSVAGTIFFGFVSCVASLLCHEAPANYQAQLQ